MGDYEFWNPLLYGISAGSRLSLERFVTAVGSVFQKGGLEIALLTPQHKHKQGIAWEVSDASPSYGVGNVRKRKEQMQKFREVIAKAQGEEWLSILTGGYTWFGGNVNNSTIVIEDSKLVVSFYVPTVSRNMVKKLEGIMVEAGMASTEAHVIDGVSVDEPHVYLTASLTRDETRVAGRLVADPHYTEVKKEAIWFSTKLSKKKGGSSHWLYDAEGVLVELRVEPNQPFLKLGQTAVQMGYILAGNDSPPGKATYLDLWHSLLPKLIDQRLVTNARLPSQEAVFREVLINCVLPDLNPEYAMQNKFRPYNAMIVGAKGVGKTMIAAMLAMQRFDSGVVVPMSQLALLDKELGILGRMREAEKRVGVKHIPVIEDLDRLASLRSDPSDGNPELSILNSDLGNILAGMGADRTVVIGTGNVPYLMDPNILEPERLGGLILWLKLPDAAEREILVRNTLAGFRPAESIDTLVSQFVERTGGYSQRMIVDVINRSVPTAAATRLNGKIPTESDFREVTELVSDDVINAACAYAERRYQFEHLKDNEKMIAEFFNRQLGRHKSVPFSLRRLADVNGTQPIPIGEGTEKAVAATDDAKREYRFLARSTTTTQSC